VAHEPHIDGCNYHRRVASDLSLMPFVCPARLRLHNILMYRDNKELLVDEGVDQVTNFIDVRPAREKGL